MVATEQHPAEAGARIERRHLVYLCIVLAAGFVLSTWACIGYTNHVDQQRRESDRRAAVERTAQNEQTRQVICRLALGNAAVYEPSTTKVGQDARALWLALADQFGCR